MIKAVIFSGFFFALLLLFVQCDTNEPPTNSTITLNLEEVSCTEAWIELTTINLQLPATVTLKQTNPTGDTKSHILNLNTKDSLLYIDSLLPNKSYQYQVTSIPQSGGQHQVSSNELSITTMDTTSHNFAFETFTFGEHDASFLWDVTIVNENSIYTVGEIYMNDTLGQPDPHPYNLAEWNGNTWELRKLTYQGYPPVVHSVCAINENDVWFDPWFHWDGQNYKELVIDPIFIGVGINKMWGNEVGIYVVGDEGFIGHRNTNGIWQNVESGTETRINDVWGIISKENETILYCPVSSFFIPGDKKILKITDGKIDSVSWDRDVRLYSAWAVNENILYVCGEEAYVNKFGVWNEIDLYPVETGSVRGNGSNDIFIVGDAGAIFHFNGVSWKMLSTPNNKSYSKVTIKGNLVVICGNYLGRGIIEVGIRN